MPAVRIADRRVWVGDESRALLSGEVHYWRLDPRAWPTVLRSCRELGLKVLSTYVCWEFHELAPGEFDFVGTTDPRRNLTGFLELVQREGFWLLIRPGPYIYAEWPNSGLPDRVVQWHRLHPSFQSQALTWMTAVVEQIRPWLATAGGPIVMLQADNEADPWTDVYGPQLGLGNSGAGLFQDFLLTRYAHIAELNAAWGSSLEDFSKARAVEVPVAGMSTPFLDFCRFRHWYATEIVRWTTAEYRQLGIDVPIASNTYSGWNVQNWRELESESDLAGPDLYPTSRIGREPREHRRFLDGVRYARTYSVLPFIPEFESGIWHGWHSGVGVLSATHYALIAYSALQAGISGWNWYMLVNRDNWYMSPINELGRPRPDLAPTFAALVNAFEKLDPPSLEKVTDTAVTIDVLARAAGVADGDGVLDALYTADIDYEFFDVDTGRLDKPLVLDAGGRWLSARGQQRLLEYVEAGGTLIFFQSLPLLDDALRPLNGLGLLDPDGITSGADPQRLLVDLGEHSLELSSPGVIVYRDVPGQPISAQRTEQRPPTQEGGYLHVKLPVGEQMTVGYVEARGKGRLVVLGIAPSAALLVALHGWLGIRIACRSDAVGVHSALFSRGQDLVAILTNTDDIDRDAVLSVNGVQMPVRVAARSGTFVKVPQT
jgi:hypothetical protein